MESPERLVFHDQTGDGDGLGDGFIRNLSVPLAFNLTPGQTIFELFENDPHHDPRASERWLAAADFRVGHDVAPQLDSMNSTVRLRFHATVLTMRPAEFVCKPTKLGRGTRESASRKAPLCTVIRDAPAALSNCSFAAKERKDHKEKSILMFVFFAFLMASSGFRLQVHP